ncbi:hypothetical protein QTJ16_006477 [Diplocarpon rosae]|uniref:Lipase B n=1 Tax=Diplocarpon rosae TaxID=946125 RepID=A0AAD9WAN5_9HELO|nr:hypothetical protein QTJ16_006477 [Diplocarpon rosae]
MLVVLWCCCSCPSLLMHLSLLLAAAPFVLAAPTPVAEPASISVPQTGSLTGVINAVLDSGSLKSAVPAVISDGAQLVDAMVPVFEALANGTLHGTDVPAVVQKLFHAVQPTATPTSVGDAMSRAADIWGVKSASAAPAPAPNILTNALSLLLEGFTSSDIRAVAAGASPFTNTATNSNRPVPAANRFYNNVQGNAPFSVSEATLRAALYIPPAFTWGQKQPILMSPGTGATSSVNFQSNIGKLLAQELNADPVYLNVPQALLGDIQDNAEFVAYALQYLYATTGQKPAIVTWSQGSLDAQWSFKYWPSIPKIVTGHIAISPDYHGTSLAYIVCPGFGTGNDIACTPALLQQEFNSRLVTRLRSNGGDSAYVPTTTIYSAVDEIVQPQQGTAASGYLQDARAVGASNTFLQGACLGQPAGLIYLHEGVLFNPVAYALVVDALMHPGPGSFARVQDQCAAAVAPGLGLADVIQAESLIPLVVINILSYMPKVTTEPALKSYANH